MQQLLLVGNPAKRRRRSTKAPSPAQKRARAAFAAMARARAGKARKNPTRKRRAKSARATSSSVTIRSNPVKHRRTRRAAPAKHHRRARRNPISSGSMRGITATLKSAAVAAGGAIGIDVAYGFIASYLPASMQTPADATTGAINYTYYAAKGAAAVGLGMLLRKAIGASRAAQVVEGSLTVTMHDAMKQFIGTNVTSLPLGAYPRVQPQRLNGLNPGRVVQLPAARGMGMHVAPTGMGAYLNAASREAAVR